MKINFLSSKILLAAILVMSINQSCTNLEEELFDTVSDANFLKTDEELNAALLAAYTNLYGFAGHNGIWSINEVSTDEALIPQRGGDWYDGGQWLRMHRHEYKANEDAFNNTWGFCYTGIGTCNRVIELLEEKAGDKPSTPGLVAELKVLRAMYYYWLLDNFGDVPIVTDFKTANATPAKNTRQEVYAFIESEITGNIGSISSNNDVATYGRMNSWTAKAILAKLYLNAERYTGAAQWQKCADVCNEIISSGKFSLASNFFANFATINKTPEIIFAIPYDQVFGKGFPIVQMTLHYQSQKTYNLQAQPWNGYCSVQEFYNSFDDSDVRKKSFIAGPQYASDGTTRLEDSGAEAADPDGAPLTFTPEINEHFPNCLRQAGVRLGKYEFALGATPDLSNDFVLFRLADIMLMRAEALWHLDNGSAEALDLVNQVRDRAGVAPFAALTPDDLLAERGREMFQEAYRRQDLIRFGKYNATRTFKPDSEDECFEFFPIPQNQLNSNPSLVQNPCYE